MHAAVERSMEAVDSARALQTILDNLTAGVIVLDAQGTIRSSNPGATRILREPLAAFQGSPWPMCLACRPLRNRCSSSSKPS
jgi:nitrogen fixation/metabolism regulation signal transduction histidine kinase